MGGRMEVAFFSEGNIEGKIPRDYQNMRTDLAWICALNADRIPFYKLSSVVKRYDLGIVIIPKKDPTFDLNEIKPYCDKVAVMQEGPNWYWQDYSLEQQVWYYNTLISADIIYTHNKSDQKYYKGLTNHSDVRVMPSLMIEDSIQLQLQYEQSGVMIGGNMTSWYGGFDSMMVAQEFKEKIYAPSMGRKIEREEELDITHLPYMNWQQWIYELRKVKYGVHLMRTHAAGTFALNCAYLGIPCIGYEGLDTQEICHPDTTVKLGDLDLARKIAQKLRKDEKFYLYCSNTAKEKYKEYYHENIFNNTFQKQFEVSGMGV
jgi:hypothetical protein